MIITVTNFRLKNSKNSFAFDDNLFFISSAFASFKRLKTSTKVAYNTVKSVKAVEEAIKDYEKTRISICESLCDKDLKGRPIIENGNYKFSEEAKREFDLKFEELLNQEITIDIFPIKQEEIEDLKDINIECYQTLSEIGFIQIDEIKEHKIKSNGNIKEEKEKINSY